MAYADHVCYRRNTYLSRRLAGSGFANEEPRMNCRLPLPVAPATRCSADCPAGVDAGRTEWSEATAPQGCDRRGASTRLAGPRRASHPATHPCSAPSPSGDDTHGNRCLGVSTTNLTICEAWADLWSKGTDEIAITTTESQGDYEINGRHRVTLGSTIVIEILADNATIEKKD